MSEEKREDIEHELHESKPDYHDVQQQRLKKYLKFQYETGASDLHIIPNHRPKLRINSELEDIDTDIYTKEDCIGLAKELIRGDFPRLVEEKSYNFTYSTPELENYRFRFNLFFQKDGLSYAIRKIENEISTIQELDLPNQIEKLLTKKSGLVLVTGATGSGKSTTMAAIINTINKYQKKHIITIEDPIEYVYTNEMGIVSQRNVGQDTPSFAKGLKDALREDPDIIVVGEVRDKETADMLLHAAETGHLVITTLHTTTAPESIQRIIGMFPSTEQDRVRYLLSGILQGVISQRLIVANDKKRKPVVELLFKTPRISNLIKQNRDDEISTALEEGKVNYGTQTFDEHLYRMIKDEVIDEKKALEMSTNPGNLQLKIKKIGTYDEEEEATETDVDSTDFKGFGLNNVGGDKSNQPKAFGIKKR